MNFGILAAGAAKGLGEGLKDLGQQWREDDIRAENNRMEMEKEKRLEEATIRAEGRKQGYEKEAEQRQIANRATIAQQDIDIANKPENVQAKANAEKTLAQAKIDVELDPNNTAKKLALKQAELDMQAASQIRVHQATDTTDYAGRALDRQIKQATLTAALESSKTPESVKTSLKGYDEQIKEDQRALSLISDDPTKSTALEKRISQTVELRNTLANKYLPEDARKAIEEITAKQKSVDTEIGNIINNGLPVEKPKEADLSNVVVPKPVEQKTVATTEKAKPLVTGGVLPDPALKYLSPDQIEKYQSASDDVKAKIKLAVTNDKLSTKDKFSSVQLLLK